MLFQVIVTLLVYASQSQAFHHKLTKGELAHTFGVEHVDHVPEYDLIRAKRHVIDDERKRIEFKAWNKTYMLDLQINKKLLSPHLISVIRDVNSSVEYEGLPTLDQSCHYIGHVVDDNHKAAISDCKRLQGVVVTDQHFLVLQSIPERLQKQHGPHVVYKRESGLINPLEHLTEFSEDTKAEVSEEHGEFCDVNSITGDISNESHAVDRFLYLNYTIPSEAKLDSLFIFPQLDPITLEIGLFLDSALYEHFKREFTADPDKHLTEFSLALINNVHVLYQQPTLSPNLDIVIVRFEMWKSQPPNLASHLHKNGQAQTLLDSFCRHQARINPGTDLTDPGHWDHGVLLTGYDIYHTTPSVAGVAPVARMCDDLFACSLVEGLHLGRSFVLAHEMGHNMGMVHDGVQNQCGRSCCLMSAVNGAGKTTWSECSVREFNAFMLQLDESGRGNCLRDPAESITSHDHLRDGRLPGQRFTADQQCSYFWGRDYQVEIPNGRNMEDICRILWCGNSGSTISTAHPALEGSWCGGEKWCQEGQCQFWKGLSPQPVVVHGDWSQWSSGDKQCAITPCQVTGSIAVNAQLRTCTNPAPNNGGRQCSGANIRGLVCGSTKSECKGLTQKEYSDHICSTIKSDPIRPDRQLSGVGFMHATQPCKVWCHVSGSEVIRNKGQLPNGSPCGDDHHCVGGVCLKLRCNGRALVSSLADCPEESPAVFKNPPKWESWGEWSSCSVSCGDHGLQKRFRVCKSGEQQCQGKPSELRDCTPEPEPCERYSAWSEWSKCSVTCGDGTRKRTRKCESGNNCTEKLMEIKKCAEEECPAWSSWEEWTKCSEKCGKKGKRSRTRTCRQKEHQISAKLCKDDQEETQECQEPDCEVQNEWGPWQRCSVSCGIGFQLRERHCNGKPCGGKQARTCNAQDCLKMSDHIIMSEWSLWSTCSETCGQGTQSRRRRCLNGTCNANESVYEEKRCVLRPCPTWTAWEPWTACSSCSESESRKRSRKCVIGLTLLGDEVIEIDSQLCSGDSEQKMPCSKYCEGQKDPGDPIFPFKKALSNWMEWESWQECSVSCGKGFRKRSRLCRPGFDCKNDGLDFEIESCEKDCKELGEWKEWSEWTACSKSCGGGRQTRTRTCSLILVFLCSGNSTEDRICNEQHCEKEKKIGLIKPEWSEWSDWSKCSCFTLKKFRRRFCVIKDPSIQGFCSGPLIEQKSCEPESCLAVSGGWSAWSEWSLCSKDCGGIGHQIRNRMCSQPLPSNRGAYCVGYSFDQRTCDPQRSCKADPIDGNWSEWTEWSTCSDPCQNGQRSRTRFCTNPSPQNNGKPCNGNDFELQPCLDLQFCGKSVNGEWSQWGQWSDCSESCGFSFKRRERHCSAPIPEGQGRPCSGLAYLTSVCRTAPCPKLNKETVVDGEWSEWSSWSDCTMHCGHGTRTRERICSSPMAGGLPCFGRSDQMESCSSSTPSLDLCPTTSNHTLAMDKYLSETLSSL
ncbi:unnamed protein product [Bursaphelenchus xylophilus]|uniref:(pine wood nematode) hypothetical protein n=1 Tax=Bursaphelenchus xylophilus TaxID=6326 RepID=A0A1I7SDE1_BURXY|nr:unnamed protein product [Bursaphelenchus xylophilus]CAG9130629.1 unnamed protein product [Bursaphelenchus xylophilus]